LGEFTHFLRQPRNRARHTARSITLAEGRVDQPLEFVEVHGGGG